MKFNKLYNLIEGVFEPASDEVVSSRKKEYESLMTQKWVEEFLKRDDIKENPDGSYDVDGDIVNLSNMGFTKIPVKFSKVNGHFSCSENNLITLEGAPTSVGGAFYCFSNNLTSLNGAPKSVGGKFICSSNSIEFTEEDVKAVCDVKEKIVVG